MSECGKILVCHPFEESACLGQVSVIRHPPTSWVLSASLRSAQNRRPPDVLRPYDESHDTFFLCVGSAVIRAVADGIFYTLRDCFVLNERYIAMDSIESINEKYVYLTDKAQALKIRLLNEMDALDEEMARKKAGNDGGGKNDGSGIDMVIKVPVKKTKNVAIKKGQSFFLCDTLAADPAA